jgi:hypothetical protein
LSIDGLSPDLKMGITWRSNTVKEHGINNVYTNGSTRERLSTVLKKDSNIPLILREFSA